jgi:hypothetical protein
VGRLPLALAQAAAVIAARHLSYATYLERLPRLPVADLLVAEEGGQYPRGVAAAVLLSLDHVRAGADGEAGRAVMDLLTVLSAAGVSRSLVHAAAEKGLPGRDGPLAALARRWPTGCWPRNRLTQRLLTLQDQARTALCMPTGA